MINTNYKYTNTPYTQNFSNKKGNYKNFQNNNISFQGHIGGEKTYKQGYSWLITETCFFRDKKTNHFVKKYILENFSNKDKIRIVSGGCSTGEEVITWSMLLDKIKDKVEILGFDLSKENIEKAKSRKFTFQRNKNTNTNYFSKQYSGFDDSYLAFNDKKNLTSEEIEYKKIFTDFFEIPKNSLQQQKPSLKLRINNWLRKMIWNIQAPEIESKQCRLKNNKALNCKFIEGDIMDLDKIITDQKADIIFFKNAMYHLITENITLERELKKNAENIVEEIITKAKTSLSPNGLLVFGEHEDEQLLNNTIVPKVMQKQGFEPLNVSKNNVPNIWKKS